MRELFRSVLISSAVGSVLAAALMILKPVTSRLFPAKWQKYAWLLAALIMIVPVWRLVPSREQATVVQTVISSPEPAGEPKIADTSPMPKLDSVPVPYRDVRIAQKQVSVYDIMVYVWIGGAALWISAAVISYILFLAKMKKNSVTVERLPAFDGAGSELGIRRRIRVRASSAVKSPMLVGAIFPVIYIPCVTIADERLRMVFLHELTHYRHKDIIAKQLAAIVNAVHWFNPLAYFITANVGEACEVACDMAVTENMSDDERKLYMATILDLLQAAHN